MQAQLRNQIEIHAPFCTVTTKSTKWLVCVAGVFAIIKQVARQRAKKGDYIQSP